MIIVSYIPWCFPWKCKLLLYCTRSGPEGSSVSGRDAPQHRDESQQPWGRLGDSAGWGQERGQATIAVERRRIERFISGKPVGIVDGRLNLTGLEWSNIKTGEYLCTMLKADVNLMPAGSEVKRSGAKARVSDYLLQAVYPRQADSKLRG